MPLYVTEYTRFGRDDRGATVPAGQEPAITTQTVAIGGGSLPSAMFNEGCRVVELHCDEACHVKFSTEKDATAATTSHKPMPAGATQFFTVAPGHMLSVIEKV